MQTTTETQAIVIPWIPVKFGAMADKPTNSRSYAFDHIELKRNGADFTVTATNGKSLIRWTIPTDEIGDFQSPLPDPWKILIPAATIKATGDKVRKSGQRLTLEIHDNQFGTVRLDSGPTHSFQPGTQNHPEVIDDLLSKKQIMADKIHANSAGLLHLLKATTAYPIVTIETVSNGFQRVTWGNNSELVGMFC